MYSLIKSKINIKPKLSIWLIDIIDLFMIEPPVINRLLNFQIKECHFAFDYWKYKL